MKRSFVSLAITFIVLNSVFPGGPAHARSATGVGTWAFACNITLAFPVAAAQAAKTNCQGDAFGKLVTVDVVSSSRDFGDIDIDTLDLGSTDVKDNIHNFLAYNVTYNETCIGGEPLPLIGTANGHAQIAGTSVLSGALKRTHTLFAWTRIGVTAIAILSNTHRENGGLDRFHKAGKASPTLPVDGVALAAFEAKQPVGSCATPNPQQAIEVIGVVITTMTQ